MRTINRNPNPPECLTGQSTKQAWSEFMHTECHHSVSASLRAEQQHVCCYCEIKIGVDDSHIEHMVPRSVNPGHDYDYGNLAASCNGGTGQHCGRFKDDRHRNPDFKYDAALFCAPHSSDTCRLFLYLANGDVVPSPVLDPRDQERATYMIGHLGLKCPRLTGSRRAHARQLIAALGPNPDPNLAEQLAVYYLQPDQNGQLQSFTTLSGTILDRPMD